MPAGEYRFDHSGCWSRRAWHWRMFELQKHVCSIRVTVFLNAPGAWAGYSPDSKAKYLTATGRRGSALISPSLEAATAREPKTHRVASDSTRKILKSGIPDIRRYSASSRFANSCGVTCQQKNDYSSKATKSWAQIPKAALAANCLDKLSGFLTNCAPLTDLNQAEDISPAGFFASSGPRTAESSQRGKERKNHESADSNKERSSSIEPF